jgi:ATP-dependent DNA helicase DinG
MMEAAFGDGGWLSELLDNYKVRPGQLELAQSIEDALFSGTHLLADAPTGCHAKGQPILLHNGKVKNVEDIKKGDKLMGPDSKPRRVLSVCRGKEKMVMVTPTKGSPWSVNHSHILSLVRTETSSKETKRSDYQGGSIIDIPVREWEKWTKSQKHLYKLFRTGVDFPAPRSRLNQPILTIRPYHLGLFLGDGSVADKSFSITTADGEIASAAYDLAKLFGLGIRVVEEGGNGLASRYYLKNNNQKGTKRNPLISEIRRLGLYDKRSNTKFIPHLYKIGSEEERLDLLAGLIDSDGHLTCNSYEIVTASMDLCQDILFVARSLGFAANWGPKKVGSGLYCRAHISGDVDRIPCRVLRKVAKPRQQKKSVLRTGFQIKHLEEGEYYGFTLDGDGRYLLGDFTVTHNTGKSMAYGIPAAIFAMATKTPVIITTANITLQEQLYRKDLPMIVQALSDKLEDEDGDTLEDMKFTLMKGMSNYVCMDKISELDRMGTHEDWFNEIADWAAGSLDGDKSELPVEYPSHIWRNVSSSADECTKSSCKHFQDCFALKARNTGGANVVVTNYHMLYTDILVRMATAGNSFILPKHKVVIMDEGHEAVDIAQSFGGFEITKANVQWLARGMSKMRQPAAKGLMAAVQSCSEKFFGELRGVDTDDIIRRPLGSDEGLVSALKESSKMISDAAGGNSPIEGTEAQRRTIARLRLLAGSMGKMAYDIEGVALGRMSESGKPVLPSGMVYYVDKASPDSGKNTDPRLCCKMVEVQEFLRENLFSLKTVVAISATMASGNNFKFISGEMGLKPGEYESKIIGSPFDPSRMLVVVPSNAPTPKERDRHTAYVCHAVERVVKTLGGRTMALFTSYRALKAVERHLLERQAHLPMKLQVLTQGRMPKSRIIETFKNTDQAVILGTSSFWQGVDIPGQALSCLIIDKFPFLPPSDPVLRYLEDMAEIEGGSIFFNYSVPKAIIALKQGSGRLIRTEQDYGVVILCDNRIDTTGYGKQFRKSFPNGHYRSSDIEDVGYFLAEMKGKDGTGTQTSQGSAESGSRAR